MPPETTAAPEPALTEPPAPPAVIRFTLSAATAAAIAADARLDSPAAPPRAQSYTESWYDTEDFTLLRHGYALSITRARRGYAQTLRQGESAVTAPLALALPDAAAFGPGWVEALAGLLGNEPLTPAYVVKTRCTTRAAGGAVLRFYTGAIQTRREKLPICELELQGPPPETFALALALAQTHKLVLQPAVPSERGILASGALRPAAVKAGPGLAGEICLDDAITTLTRACLAQFTANWPVFFAGGEVEAVHQMRVAMRRLRSLLGLFNRHFTAPEFTALRDEAKRIANVMGEARNWDVFTGLLQAGPLPAFPHEPGFSAMLTQCADFRAGGYAAVRDLLAAPATTQFLLRAELFLARHGWRGGLPAEALTRLTAPARDFAGAELHRLHRKVRKRGRHLVRLGAHERHLTRIELKKLRYATEFFGGLFEGQRRIRAYNRSAAALQEELGHLNDLATASELLARMDGTSLERARAIGIVLGWCAQAAAADDKALAKRWKAFTEAKPFTS